MAHVAIIVSIAGDERYLRGHEETPEAKKAQRFRSEESAKAAARAHIEAFHPCIRRNMSFRVEAL